MKALVFGGSGLIGHELVLNLLQNSKLEILHFAGRKKPDFDHPKMNYIPWSLNLTASLPAELFAGANVFCCLGSTMAKAKSKDAFRAVDFDGPLGIAQRAAGAGALSFSLVSAFFLKPSVTKNAAEPMTADSANNGFILMEAKTVAARKKDAMA